MFNDNETNVSKLTDGIKDFMASNSLIAKFAFILFVLLIFVLTLRLGVGLMSTYFSPTGTPKLFVGMYPGNVAKTFPQSPLDASKADPATTIIRSTNERGGIEFTWSLWIFLEADPTATKYKHIFSKGNPQQYASKYSPGESRPPSNGLMFPNNAPGLYVTPGRNELLLIMNTFDSIDQEVTIDNMPFNKWVNVIIRVKDKNLDIFINGIITKNLQFSSPPRQNYENVQLHLNGGFSGYTSNLWYYNYALGTNAINSIVYWGPNTKLAESNGLTDTTSDYLSSKWYFGGQGDMFNPTGARGSGL